MRSTNCFYLLNVFLLFVVAVQSDDESVPLKSSSVRKDDSKTLSAQSSPPTEDLHYNIDRVNDHQKGQPVVVTLADSRKSKSSSNNATNDNMQRPDHLEHRTVSGSRKIRCLMTPFVVDGQSVVRMRKICYEETLPPLDFNAVGSP